MNREGTPEKKIQPQMNQPSREAMAGKLQIYADEDRLGLNDAMGCGGARLPKDLTSLSKRSVSERYFVREAGAPPSRGAGYIITT